MNRKTLFAILVMIFSCVAVPAMAAGPYVGGEVGVAFLSDSTFTTAGVANDVLKNKTGFGLGLLGGFDFGTYRLEGEFVYRRNNNKEADTGAGIDPVDGDYSSMALMANGYYDFRTVSKTFVPYLGLGIGYARVSIKATDPPSGFTFLDDNDMVFAYQLAAGVGFAVSKEFTLDLGYKYFATAKPEFGFTVGGTTEGEYASHNLFLGARYSF